MQVGSDVLNDPNAQVIRATESFVYPQFDGAKKVHDIMLVKLSRPATLSATVRTLAVSSKCVSHGTTCMVSGWGSTTGRPFGEKTPGAQKPWPLRSLPSEKEASRPQPCPKS